jgi:hypothetical protein
MIKELYDLSQAEQADHRVSHGGFNNFPTNWEEIDAQTFAKSDYFTWTPVLTEFRQMIPTPRTGLEMAVSAHLHWMPSGLGYSIVNDYWAGGVRYYRFGQKRANWLEGIDSSD